MDVTGRGPARGRGQAFTLEAVVAAVVLLGSVAFAMQVVAVTANTSSTADDDLTDHHRGIAAGVLEVAAGDGSLERTLYHWNHSEEAFHGAEGESYVATAPPTEFGALLERSFDDRGVRYNVDVRYVAADGDLETRPLVDHGTPTDDAVRVSTTVPVYDDDPLYDADGKPSNTTVEDGDFYAPDAAPDEPLYNVVRVEVIVWTA